MPTTNSISEFLRALFGLKRQQAPQKNKLEYEDWFYKIKEEFSYSFNRIEKQIDGLYSSQTKLQEEIHSYLVTQSLGIDPNVVPLYRFLPIRIYLTISEPNRIRVISNAITTFSRSIGFEISDHFPPETSSWFQRWFVKSKDIITQPEVTERLKKGERALELATLQKYQATVDKEQAEAASTLLRSLEQVPNAVCQIGSILLIKITDSISGTRVYTRSLTTQEMIYLERNQHLLKNPQTILEALAQHCSNLAELPSEETNED